MKVKERNSKSHIECENKKIRDSCGGVSGLKSLGNSINEWDIGTSPKKRPVLFESLEMGTASICESPQQTSPLNKHQVELVDFISKKRSTGLKREIEIIERDISELKNQLKKMENCSIGKKHESGQADFQISKSKVSIFQKTTDLRNRTKLLEEAKTREIRLESEIETILKLIEVINEVSDKLSQELNFLREENSLLEIIVRDEVISGIEYLSNFQEDLQLELESQLSGLKRQKQVMEISKQEQEKNVTLPSASIAKEFKALKTHNKGELAKPNEGHESGLKNKHKICCYY